MMPTMKTKVSTPRYAGFLYPLPAFSRFFLLAVSMALLSLAPAVYAQTNNYFGTNGTLNGSVWSTNPAGPYTSALDATGGAIINFGNAATFNGNTIIVAGINATANATIGTNTGTISNFSNGVITIDVGTGATLDFGAQSFTTSATAGYIKNGNGVLALSGNTYGGNFTINSGTVILRGVNAMGGNATQNTLTINGGTIAANATRDLSGKYSGITVGGNFTLGATTGLASSAANLTFNATMALGAATRTITIGGTGTYNLGGNISASAGTGLTVDSTAAGKLALKGANNFDGGLTIKSGTVSLNTATAAGSGTITLGDTTSGNSNNATLDLEATASGPYTNDLTVAAGTSGALTIVSSSTANGGTINGTLNLNNNLIVNLNTGALKTMKFAGQTIVGSGAIAVSSNSADKLEFAGGLALGGSGVNGLTINNNNTATTTIGTGNISGTGPLTLNANNTGAITVSAISINHTGTITNSGSSNGTTTISGTIGSNVTGLTQNSTN